MPKNTIYTIGAVIFMFGVVLSNQWLRIGTLNAQAIWIMTIGFALSFIARSGGLKLAAGLVFAFGLALAQGWLKDIPQVQPLFIYSGWIMVGGYALLSFSR